MTPKRDLTIKPAQGLGGIQRRIFGDGYDLDREFLVLRHLINAEEINPADPMFPRYQIYTERLEQWTLLQKTHSERSGAEPDVPLEQARKVTKMSPLRSAEEDSMSLHTLEAMRLFLGAIPAPGEVRYGVPGGRRCATALRQLFLLSAQDNPYADLALCQVDDRVTEIKKQIAVLEKMHLGLLDQAKLKGLNYSVLGAQAPQAVSLGYHSPYGYAISNLIVLFDYLVRVLKSTERRDLSTKKEVHQQLTSIKRDCRSLFESAMNFARILLNKNMLGLSRLDWLPTGDAAAAQRVEAALKTLGPVPHDIFTGERSPRHSLRNERLSKGDRKVLEQIAVTLEAGAHVEVDASAALDGIVPGSLVD